MAEVDKAQLSKVWDNFSHMMTGMVEAYTPTAADENEEKEDDRTTGKREVKQRAQLWADVWRNNGVHPETDQQITIEDMLEKCNELASTAKDAITSTEYRNLIPLVVSNVIREPLPQNTPLTQLMAPVRFSNGTSISFPAVGAAGNLELDMAEGEEYPELHLDFSGSVIATIGKSGIAVNFTEELVRYSAFDMVALHSRQAMEALRRHKENKIATHIFSIGQTFIDNEGTNTRRSGGRDINANPNYTLIVDDLIDAYIDALQEGWQLDTLIVHPLAWTIFAKDPILREQFFRGLAGGAAFWSPPTGGSPFAPELGVNTPYGGNVGPSAAFGLPNGANINGAAASTMAFQVPSYGGIGFNVIVTPYAPIKFDAPSQKYRTDILMIQRDQAGLLVIDEDVTADQWTDPRVDVHKIKWRERYSIVNLNQGKAGRLLKNIVIDRAFFLEDKVIYDNANGDLPDTIGAGPIDDVPSSSSSSSSA